MLKYDIEELESLLRYHFKDKELLNSAITHISFLNETRTKPKYAFKKLEFIGDAVLELTIRKFLFESFATMSLNDMFKNKINLVNNSFLAKLGLKLGLNKYIKKSKGERNKKIPETSVIADVFEAICGAIFLDSMKLSTVESFIFFHFNDILQESLEL